MVVSCVIISGFAEVLWPKTFSTGRSCSWITSAWVCWAREGCFLQCVESSAWFIYWCEFCVVFSNCTLWNGFGMFLVCPGRNSVLEDVAAAELTLLSVLFQQSLLFLPFFAFSLCLSRCLSLLLWVLLRVFRPAVGGYVWQGPTQGSKGSKHPPDKSFLPIVSSYWAEKEELLDVWKAPLFSIT